MIDFTSIKLEQIAIHKVGNKLRDEGTELSTSNINIESPETNSYLLKYMLSPFDNSEAYNFTHSSEIELNEIFNYSKDIFRNPAVLHGTSLKIAKHLYEKTLHPKINGGEIFICFFKDCVFRGVKTPALGIFKSEVKDIFLKINNKNNNFNINHESGVNINKLDRGCLILDIEEENGYKIFITDSNKLNDTNYWKNEFLNIKQAADEFSKTKEFLSITKNFVTKKLSNELKINKAEQIDILNRSVDYFKTHEKFSINEFEKNILKDTKIIKSFREFDNSYRSNNNLEVNNSFEISAKAVKKQAQTLKKVIKLDKNFHIYIHGDKELIEQGVDKNGKKFYKIYFEKEE